MFLAKMNLTVDICGKRSEDCDLCFYWVDGAMKSDFNQDRFTLCESHENRVVLIDKLTVESWIFYWVHAQDLVKSLVYDIQVNDDFDHILVITPENIRLPQKFFTKMLNENRISIFDYKNRFFIKQTDPVLKIETKSLWLNMY